MWEFQARLERRDAAAAQIGSLPLWRWVARRRLRAVIDADDAWFSAWLLRDNPRLRGPGPSAEEIGGRGPLV